MIRLPGLKLIKQAADGLTRKKILQPWKALSLSYQDVLATDEELTEIFTPEEMAKLEYRKDSHAIVRWHKCEHLTTRIPDWHQMLGLLGFKAVSTDLIPARGCEEHLDITATLPRNRVGQYDLVIDNVAHHCAAISLGLANIAKIPKVGGYILHHTPLVMPNHGLFSISPAWFSDFYPANGYKIVAHQWYAHDRTKPVAEVHTMPDPSRRMGEVSYNAFQLVLVRRMRAVPRTVWPLQTKFVICPDSKN